MHLLKADIKNFHPWMLVLFVVFAGVKVSGQNIQWADTVYSFSSERKISNHVSKLHPNAYKARMILGKPNVMPGNEGTSRVWTPQKSNSVEYIKVGFAQPMKVKQIAIAEVFNPTAIDKVYLYDVDGGEIEIDILRPRSLDLPGRLLNIFIDETPKEILAVKIVLDGNLIPGFSGIDAVAISDSYKPISVNTTISDGLHTSVDPEKLDDNINSPFKEIKPLLSPDGKTMFFSRINHPENMGGEKDMEDIWLSQRNEETGMWSKATNAGPLLNNEGPNFIAAIAPAGYTYSMLLGNIYRPNGKMTDGLSITTKTSEGFTPPEKVEIKNFYNYAEQANFSLASSGQAILMSIQRDDTHGDRDIYVSTMQTDGTWSEPLNLGGVINTGEKETSPFLASDNKTLYFSSNGHLGYGKGDIFISRRLDSTWVHWSEPENLGTIVNSPEDDVFFYISESDTKYAYFTRGYGKDADIFRLLLPLFYLPEPIVKMQGRILNAQTMEPISDARVSFRDIQSKVILGRQYSEMGTGRYQASLPLGRLYELYANAEGYVSIESEHVDLMGIYEPDTVIRDILLDPVTIGKRIPMDRIYFGFNESTLKDESIPQLNLVFEFLLENPNVVIEMDGHTCAIGTDEYNQKLSEERALAVRDYLIRKGIKPKRITSIGHGEENPLATNETEEGRILNRRVEFVIKEM